jgi:hypothetical protein
MLKVKMQAADTARNINAKDIELIKRHIEEQIDNTMDHDPSKKFLKDNLGAAIDNAQGEMSKQTIGLELIHIQNRINRNVDNLKNRIHKNKFKSTELEMFPNKVITNTFEERMKRDAILAANKSDIHMIGETYHDLSK